MELPLSVDRKEVMADNTYLLTLDGDIDFQPQAVQLLVDLMKKNRNLGAACGRIHPVGSGTFTKKNLSCCLRGTLRTRRSWSLDDGFQQKQVFTCTFGPSAMSPPRSSSTKTLLLQI